MANLSDRIFFLRAFRVISRTAIVTILVPCLIVVFAFLEVKAQTAAEVENTGLPIVRLNLWDPTTLTPVDIDSKDHYEIGSISILPSKATAAFSYPSPTNYYETPIPLSAKGRGNSTWTMPKKGYRLKLNESLPLLDMPADTDWVLLANYADKTLLRAYVAFELSRRFFGDVPGSVWTPRLRFVELYLNDQYLGNYLLGEHVKVGANRVNVTKFDKKANPPQPGPAVGYLLEIDFPEYLVPTDKYFMTALELYFNIKAPDSGVITTDQYAYISDFIEQVETSIYSENFADPMLGYTPNLDVDSLINWFLVNEIYKNLDAMFRSSVYWHKEVGGKLKMGPVWDFDFGAGNVDFSNARHPTGWWVKQSDWIGQLFNDPAFSNKVNDRWHQLKQNQIATIFAFIDQTAEHLEKSQTANFQRWPILNEPVWPCPLETKTYAEQVYYYKNFLKQRIDWMDTEFPPTLIVDDRDAGTSVTGTWEELINQDGYNGRYLRSDKNIPDNMATFSATLPRDGKYEVAIWYNSYRTHASKVPVDILNASTNPPTVLKTLFVNQRRRGGSWVRLGAINFNQGNIAQVRIRTKGTNGYVIADAIRFRKIP